MKILIIHNKYRARYIGGEDVVYNRELGCLKKEIGSENVFEYCVSNDDVGIFSVLLNIFFSKKHFVNVYNIVKNNNIDIVHVHNFFPVLTASVFVAAKKAGAKTIQTLHNYRWWCLSGVFYRNDFGNCELCSKNNFFWKGVINKCYRESFIQSFVTAFAFFFYKKIIFKKYIDYFFVLTKDQKEKVISLGVNPEKIFLKPNFFQFSNILNNINEKKDFIYVGKMDESKGVKFLIDIWKTLDRKYVLYLVGSGDLDEEIKKLDLENIKFLGKTPTDKTIELISGCRYLINSSLMRETFGLTIIDSMSVGTPVLGLNIGTRNELILNGYNGFVSSQNDFRELILRANDYQGYEDMCKNSKRFAENFSSERVIKEQMLNYKKILNI